MGMLFQGHQSLEDWGQGFGVRCYALEGVTAEVGDAPPCGAGSGGLSYPAQHLLEPPGGGGGEAAGFQFGKGLLLFFG